MYRSVYRKIIPVCNNNFAEKSHEQADSNIKKYFKNETKENNGTVPFAEINEIIFQSK